MSTRRIQIGELVVESGKLMVCDPSYVNEEWMDGLGDGRDSEIDPAHAPFSYDGACAVTLSAIGGGQLFFKEGESGVGVVTRTAYGDGIYRVFLELENGQLMRLIVELN